MAHIYFDIIRRANSTAYVYGDLVAPATLNDHVYMCTTPGTSDSSPPTFNTGGGSTTTDGTVTWTEYNPSGITYQAVLAPAIQPKYGDYQRVRKYIQPIDYSEGGDVYVYNKNINPKNHRSIRYGQMTAGDYAKLMEFIDIVRGASFPFNFYDENGTAKKVILTNADEIASNPVHHGIEGDIELNLLFL